MDFGHIAQINIHDEETMPYDLTIYDAAQLDFSEDYEVQRNGEEVHK